MSRTWDIVENVFSARSDMMQPQTCKRRPIADVSSMLQFAIVVSLGSATTANAPIVIPAAERDLISDMRVVFQRSLIALKMPLPKEKRQGIDFARARSAEKLADSFQAFFKPSTHIDDSSDEGFVFN